MLFKFSGKRIKAVITVVPKNESCFDDEINNYNFPPRKSMKLKELMGYNKHRIVKEGITSSDLARAGFKQLFQDKIVNPEEIDAVIYITQSPDYFMPQTSVLLLEELGFKKDILCIDMNQGCAGFEHGLFQAFFLLDNPAIKTVAVVTADVLSSKVNKKDRNSYPLMGDAAAVTIVENDTEAEPVYCFNRTFGEGCLAINIPAGGFRLPCNENTKVELLDVDGNTRCQENLVMQGASVFSFVQEKVPEMVAELLSYAKLSKDEIDYYVFHQPNKFMLEKLADKIEIDVKKMPNNVVENFGNSSSATVPTNLCFNLSEILAEKQQKLFFGGFGIGLTLAGIIMNVKNLNYCKLIDWE